MNNNKEYYIVFDDGGLITSNPDNTGFKIDFVAYERLLELAKRNDIKIPIACTASFFDFNNCYDKSIINKNAEKIIRLVQNNKDYLEIWNHGLTHMYNNEYTEFYSYVNGKVSHEIQEYNIKTSRQIFETAGIKTQTFVPPGHAWEQDVTDLIASKYGFKEIAVREFEKTSLKSWIKNPLNRYKKQWNKSKYINTLFRLGLGIPHDKTNFAKRDYKKTKLYITQPFPINILINRKIKFQFYVDHFFAHIQNLSDEKSLAFFDYVIKKMKLKVNKN